MEFQVDPEDASKVVKSPSMVTDTFSYHLQVYPKGESIRKKECLAVYVSFSQKNGLVDGFPLGSKVRCSVELVNHSDPSKSIMRQYSRFLYPGFSYGWENFVNRSKVPKENGWLDAQGKLVFRASASVVKEDPNPLKPNEHEVRFNGREEYDIGDEFKSPPTWKGNYKFQLAVYPGGLESGEDKRGLAVYVHLLGKRDVKLSNFLKLRISLLNSSDSGMTIEWYCTHTFDESGKQSWGCPHLIDIDDLKNQQEDWLHDTGEIVIRATVQPAVAEGSNPSEILVDQIPRQHQLQCSPAGSVQHTEVISSRVSHSAASEKRSSEGGETSNGSWVMEDNKGDEAEC